mmetsp:Transcript_15204/g.31854  ORF Transcript_15204/g.31854 Transcript_15204/m.31854 type:complete len:245 (+) Transcript_15204:292-1026(+)
MHDIIQALRSALRKAHDHRTSLAPGEGALIFQVATAESFIFEQDEFSSGHNVLMAHTFHVPDSLMLPLGRHLVIYNLRDDLDSAAPQRPLLNGLWILIAAIVRHYVVIFRNCRHSAAVAPGALEVRQATAQEIFQSSVKLSALLPLEVVDIRLKSAFPNWGNRNFRWQPRILAGLIAPTPHVFPRRRVPPRRNVRKVRGHRGALDVGEKRRVHKISHNARGAGMVVGHSLGSLQCVDASVEPCD